jgi:hypothetical protein
LAGRRAMAVGIMDKQINLYRNVFRAEQLRRKLISVGIFVLSLVLLAAWVSTQRVMQTRAKLLQNQERVANSIKTEQMLVDSLRAEIKNRDVIAEKEAQNDFASALASLNRKQEPTQLAQLGVWLNAWKGDGARIKKIEVDKTRFLIVGEAKSSEHARAALREMGEQVSKSPDWILNKHPIVAKQAEVVEFSLSAAAAAAVAALPKITVKQDVPSAKAATGGKP